MIKRRKSATGVITGYIEKLCHTVNKAANSLPRCVPWQEFHWAVEIAIQNSGLPDTWIKAACQPQMTQEYQKSFHANGYCLSPADIEHSL